VTLNSDILKQTARDISSRMQEVAVPDSHFHLDFSQFIPGFIGSAEAANRFAAHPLYDGARQVFATPDNSLIPLRQMLLEADRDLVMPSYGLHRGFILIEAARIPKGQTLFASWLDGMEYFGTAVSLAQLLTRGPFDFIITGASVITTGGLRFGMGAQYLDVEWGVLAAAGLVRPLTPVVALVHDIQVVEANAEFAATNVLADYIVTPSRLLRCPESARPTTLDWSIVGPDLAASPPLRELRT
jgi:5-formyltetrahydrofolate cyclo-ligase